jgi:hypothetical protein
VDLNEVPVVKEIISRQVKLTLMRILLRIPLTQDLETLLKEYQFT